jgi:hypothetical protein
MKKFNVTFTTKDKYHPTTRTVMVETENAYAAGLIISDKFDSTKVIHKMWIPSGKKITIDKVEEVKEEKVDKDGN